MRKILTATAFLLTFAMLMPFFMLPASSQTLPPTVIIQSDGTISPSTAPIQQNGDTYTFTDNLYATIKIQKSNITLDGAGYTLWGPYGGEESDLSIIGASNGQPYNSTQQYTIGVDLWGTDVQGITVQNLKVENFSIGMYMWTKNNTLIGNQVTQTVVGIMLSGSNTTVTQNLIENNTRGVFFGFKNEGTIPADMFVYKNAFVGNIIQLNGCECKSVNQSEPPHNWDKNGIGNFWSNYNGTDTNNDGVGDSAYIIDSLNRDRYPLMQNPEASVATASQLPFEIIIIVAAFAALSIGLRVAMGRAKRKV